MKARPLLLLAMLGFLGLASFAVAEVTWYFNWYCSGCARIGARTTGTEGPFSSQGDCESARSSMHSNMDRRGGGVRAENCYSVGFESPAPSQPSGERAPQGQPGYSRPTYPQPQYEDTRRQEEENRRQEAERRKQEEEAERAHQAEIQRQRENFLRERDDAARRLRGADSAPVGIRGHPTGPLEIRGLPEREGRTSGSSRFPVWQQLNCIHNIFKGLVAAANVAKKHEMEYLRQEMKNAMDSLPLGVSCEQAPPPPKPYGERELNQSKIVSFYQKLVDATWREGEKLQTANRDIEHAEANVRRAREGLEKPRPSAKPEERQPVPESPRERPEVKTKDDPITRAYEQQKAYQEKESRKIEEVYKQQKEKQAPLEDYSINLRAAQRQLNESNSRKIEATNQLNRYSQMSDQVLANPGRAGELEQALTQRRN